jgi:ketosteroid isomerase-like protein
LRRRRAPRNTSTDDTRCRQGSRPSLPRRFDCCGLDALRALFTDDAVVQGVLGWGGMDVTLPIWRELHEAFRQHLTIEALIAEGDLVAARYTERGTSVGAFRGQAPTGKSFESVAMEWFVIRDGRIARRWGARDSASQLRQMGLVVS